MNYGIESRLLSRDLVTRNEQLILKQFNDIQLTIQTQSKKVEPIKFYDGRSPEFQVHRVK